jgi:hypothetical protein
LLEFITRTAIYDLVLQICLYYDAFYDLRAVRRKGEQRDVVSGSRSEQILWFSPLFWRVPTLLGRRLFLMSMSIAGGASVMISRLRARYRMAHGRAGHRVALLGKGDLALKVAEEISSRGNLNLRVSGFIAFGNQSDDRTVGNTRYSALPPIMSIVAANAITKMVVAVDNKGEAGSGPDTFTCPGPARSSTRR